MRNVEWLSLRVRGFAVWPRKETELTFGGRKFLLKPANAGKKQEKHICLELSGIDLVEGRTLINRFLSMLAWCDSNSAEALEGVGTRLPQPYSETKPETVSESFEFPFSRELEKDKKTQLALALYREGVTLNSIPFQFLSFFKVLNIFWDDKWKTVGKKQRVRPIVEGLKDILSKLTDKLAIERIAKLKASGISDVATHLYELGRCAVAHAYQSPIVDPDDASEVRRLSEDLDIIQAAAEYLIETTLGVEKRITG